MKMKFIGLRAKLLLLIVVGILLLFTFLFFAGFLFFIPFFYQTWFYSFTKSLHLSFLDIVVLWGELCKKIPGSFIDVNSLPFLLQGILVFGAGALVLTRIAEASKATKSRC